MKNLVTGLTLGIVLGLMFAPEKGAKLRKRLMTMGEDYADDVKDQLSNLKDKVDSIADKVGLSSSGVRETERLLNKEYNKAK